MMLSEVAREVGATDRQIDHWANRGYLRFERTGTGHGYPRLFPNYEVLVARWMVRLVDAGFTAERAAELARAQVFMPSSHAPFRLADGVAVTLTV